MSSSNQVVPLDISQLNTIHSSMNGNSNVGVHVGQTVVVYNSDGNAYIQNENVNVNAGTARDVGIGTSIRNTYPARYNFAVKQYNKIPDNDTPAKRHMRGGHFLMYRSVKILAFLICVITAGISAKVKPVIAVDIVISLIYIILSIYNIVIYKRNGSLFSRRMIHDNQMTTFNKYFRVPISTTVSQTNVLANAHQNIIAGLRNTYNNLTEIDVMVYHGDYVRTLTYFPWKNVIMHMAAFLFVMILGLFLAAIVHTS